MMLLLLVLATQTADLPATKTRTIECRDGDTVPLRVHVSSPTENVLTAVTFPDAIQNVVSAWNERDLSVEYQGAKLFLKLLAKVEGHLDVVTTAGLHVRLYIKPAAAEQEPDEHVVLKAAPPAISETAQRKTPDALELVRAMRLGVVPPGVSVRRGGNAVVLTAGDLEGTLAFLYETTWYRGYVLRLENKSRGDGHQLDVTRFASPKLVLAGAKSLLIPPQKSTLVYLVFWK